MMQPSAAQRIVFGAIRSLPMCFVMPTYVTYRFLVHNSTQINPDFRVISVCYEVIYFNDGGTGLLACK
jgi:hypothetical protein